MGLAEKRAVAEFETTIYPTLQSQIREAAGFDIPIEVRWETLAKEDKYVNGWKAGWPKIYFQPIIDAFRAICTDDLGKQALKSSLQKIVVQNTKSSFSSDWASYNSGTLTLDYMYTNVDSVADRTKVLRTTLEKNL